MIIGGGAAGLYLASFHPEATILEQRGECGQKLIITGGGRCNYTNAAGPEEMSELFHGNKAFIKRVLYAHTSMDIIEHFKTLGIQPSEEEMGKIFPLRGDAASVRSALLKRVHRIIKGKAVSIEKNDDAFIVHMENGTLEARRVVIATGGESFPHTGSDGSGYAILKALGHTIVPTAPALAPIALSSNLAKAEGISLKARLGVGKRSEYGDIIITRRGISGPAALNISRELADSNEIEITFSEASIKELRESMGARTVKNALAIPPRLTEALIGSLADRKCGNLSRKEEEEIQGRLSHFRSRAKAIREGAMNTRGGVSASEINPKTMESKIVPGLYISGDVIDVDGPTGGYSLSFAFATAFIISRALAVHDV